MSETQEQTTAPDETKAADDDTAEAQTTEGAEEAAETLLTSKEEEAKGETEGEEKKDEEAKEEPAEGPPEAYEDFTLPDDYWIPDDLLSSFQTLAKEAGLTQEQAQAFVDRHVEMTQRTEAAHHEFLIEENKRWMEAAKADEEIGGGLGNGGDREGSGAHGPGGRCRRGRADVRTVGEPALVSRGESPGQ